jgi:hypothetical protein
MNLSRISKISEIPTKRFSSTNNNYKERNSNGNSQYNKLNYNQHQNNYERTNNRNSNPIDLSQQSFILTINNN